MQIQWSAVYCRAAGLGHCFPFLLNDLPQNIHWVYCHVRLSEGGTQHPATTQLPAERKRYVNVGAGKDDSGRENYRLQGIYDSITRQGGETGLEGTKAKKVNVPSLLPPGTLTKIQGVVCPGLT